MSLDSEYDPKRLVPPLCVERIAKALGLIIWPGSLKWMERQFQVHPTLAPTIERRGSFKRCGRVHVDDFDWWLEDNRDWLRSEWEREIASFQKECQPPQPKLTATAVRTLEKAGVKV